MKESKNPKSKFLLFTGLAFVLLLVLLVLVTLVTISFPNVKADDVSISLVSYEPKPVVPGTFFATTFRVDNLANKDLDVKIELNAKEPFFIEGNNDLKISVDEDKSETFTFTLGLRNTAQSGFKTLSLDWETASDDGSATFSIQIKAIETTLTVESVESSPAEIAPGEEAIVHVGIKNEANLRLKDIKVKLDLNSAALPFAPKGGVTEKNIDTLSPNTESTLEFNIIALSNAVAGIYKVPLNINYFDEFGQAYSIQDVISLIIGSKPNLAVNVEESNLIVERKSKVTINIVNSGLTDAKFLNVQLLPSTDFSIISASAVYVGDLDSDDSEDVEFELVSSKTGFVSLQLQINYRDANNKAYTEITNLPVKVYSVNEAKQLGLIKTNFTLIIIITIVVILIIIFLIRRLSGFRRKERE